MPARRTARERVRAEITREITDIARTHLAADGAAALSLRAVARDMGMVSSAIYRYFASRDDLLTALIIDGYNAIGEAVENAEAACRRDDYPGRWMAACRAARAWAVAHPHEYALIYGSPVPGYQAPPDTIGPAARSVVVVGRLISDAFAAGELTPVPGRPPMPNGLAEDATRLRDTILPGVPDEVVIGTLTALSGVFGLISFELFGQFNNGVTDTAGYFGLAVADLARHLLGLSALGTPGPRPPAAAPRDRRHPARRQPPAGAHPAKQNRALDSLGRPAPG